MILKEAPVLPTAGRHHQQVGTAFNHENMIYITKDVRDVYEMQQPWEHPEFMTDTSLFRRKLNFKNEWILVFLLIKID